ncbi:hypothetical protein PybrP1_008483, partial [[Pythium] brassicae (nom. inval.)]
RFLPEREERGVRPSKGTVMAHLRETYSEDQ